MPPYRSPVTRYRFLYVTVIRHRLLSSASTLHYVYSCLLLWDSFSTCSYTLQVTSCCMGCMGYRLHVTILLKLLSYCRTELVTCYCTQKGLPPVTVINVPACYYTLKGCPPVTRQSCLPVNCTLKVASMPMCSRTGGFCLLL